MNIEEIKVLRLKTGDDVIGYVSDIDDNRIHIRNPMLIDIMTDYKSAKQSFVIQSWLPHQLIKTNETTLWSIDILTILEPTETFIDYYTDMVTKIERYNALAEIMEHLEDEEEISEAMEEKDLSVVH